MKRWNLTFEKISSIKLHEPTNNNILKRLAEITKKPAYSSFRSKIEKLPEPEEIDDNGQKKYRYEVEMILTKKKIRSEEATQKQFATLTDELSRKAQQDGWKLKLDDVGTETLDSGLEKIVRPVFIVPELTPEVMTKYFDGIFEREAHIRVIHDAVKSSIDSISKHNSNSSAEICRSHILLKGKPAGCKTTLFERFIAWYGADGVQRAQLIDGQTMSKAGLENWILEKAATNELPEIIVIEEIEKLPIDNLLPLISIMGSGYLAKLNARIGFRRESTPVIIWATCNNDKIIREFREGVLWSRFTHRLHCARPSKLLMKEILLRRIRSLQGNELWADKILEFAYETWYKVTGKKIDDPREILGFLDGKDRLLDGSYQKDMLEIVATETKEKKDEEQNGSD